MYIMRACILYLIFVSEIHSLLKENAFTHGTGTDRLSVCSSRSGGAQCVPVSLQGHEGKTRSESGVGEQGFTTQAKFSRHSVALRNLYKQMFHHWKAQFLMSALETILLGQDRAIFVKEIQQSSPFHEAYLVINQRKTNHWSPQPGSSCWTKYFKQVRNNIWTQKLAMKLQMISMKNDYLERSV